MSVCKRERERKRKRKGSLSHLRSLFPFDFVFSMSFLVKFLLPLSRAACLFVLRSFCLARWFYLNSLLLLLLFLGLLVSLWTSLQLRVYLYYQINKTSYVWLSFVFRLSSQYLWWASRKLNRHSQQLLRKSPWMLSYFLQRISQHHLCWLSANRWDLIYSQWASLQCSHRRFLLAHSSIFVHSRAIKI